MSNIFDPELSSLVAADTYRAAVMPELYPDARPMRVDLWHPEDRAAFCGGEWTECASGL